MTDLLVLGLAVWQAVETWRHGSIFFRPRQFFREQRRHPVYWRRWSGELLSCPFCLPHWVALIFVIGWFCDWTPAKLAIWALAATRLAQLGNDLTHEWNRSPPRDPEPEDEQYEFTDPSGM